MIQSLMSYLYKKLNETVGSLTLLRVALLWLALTSFGLGLLRLVQRVEGVWILWTVSAGLLTGWLLARTRLTGLRYSLLTASIGLIWLVLTVGRIFNPLSRFLSAWLGIFDQAAFKGVPFAALQTGDLAGAWNDFASGLLVVLDRLIGWIRAVSSGGELVDPIITTMAWAAVVWLFSVWATWFVRRKGIVILGLIPALALLAYDIYYTNTWTAWLVFLGGSMLLLQAVTGYRSAHQRWLAARVDRVELESTLTTFVLSICLVLTLTGGLTPSVSFKDIQKAVNHYLEVRRNERLAKSLGLEQVPGSGGSGSGLGSASAGPAALMSVHWVGAGPKLTQDMVMTVGVEGFSPPVPSNVYQNFTQPVPVEYYWRSQTYDRYTGSGWSTASVSDTLYHPYEQLLPGLAESVPANLKLVSGHVERIGDPAGPLFVSGELVAASQSYRATFRAPGDLIGAEITASSYDVDSRMQIATASQLRSAGFNYPAEITDRYLQLPDSVPDRVRSLALDITASQTSPYDQLIAIETHLRKLPYTLEVPAPPAGRDVADFFLFNLKKGYCDYYATTMVVMARSVGIPSRLVSGYASNMFNYQSQQFVVRQANAHSWVEAYFPGYGWVEFEPTASLPEIQRTGNQEVIAPVSTPGASADSQNQTGTKAFNYNFLGWIALILGAVILLVAFYQYLPIDRLILLLRPGNEAVSIIFRRLYRLGSRSGIETSPTRTPHEFTAALSTRLEQRAARHGPAPVIKALRADLDWLTGLYARLLYSPHTLTREDHREAVRVWVRLRRGLRRRL